MIDTWGGWHLFQELLSTLKLIAQKHSVSISNVAVRYVLDRPAVAGEIIDARLGVSQHLEDNAKVFSFTLDIEDRNQISAVLTRSQNLYQLSGDCDDRIIGADNSVTELRLKQATPKACSGTKLAPR